MAAGPSGARRAPAPRDELAPPCYPLGPARRPETTRWLDYPGFVLGIVVTSGISYLILAYADQVMERLGPKGSTCSTGS